MNRTFKLMADAAEQSRINQQDMTDAEVAELRLDADHLAEWFRDEGYRITADTLALFMAGAVTAFDGCRDLTTDPVLLDEIEDHHSELDASVGELARRLVDGDIDPSPKDEHHD